MAIISGLVFKKFYIPGLGFCFYTEKVSPQELVEFIRQEVVNNPTPSLPGEYYAPGPSIDWQRVSNSLNSKKFDDLEMIFNNAENWPAIGIDGIPNIWNKMELKFDESDLPILNDYRRQFPKSPWSFILRGEFYKWYAWEARGNGYANTVTNDGWIKMKDRLKKAFADYLSVVKTRPRLIYAYSGAGFAAMNIGRQHTALRLYQKALKYDPAYWCVLNCLLDHSESKWFGPDDDFMFEFARSISSKHPEYPYLKRLVILAHEENARLYADGNATKAKDYLNQPDVWNEITASYKDIFIKYPESKYAKKYYDKICRRAGKANEIDRLLSK